MIKDVAQAYYEVSKDRRTVAHIETIVNNCIRSYTKELAESCTVDRLHMINGGITALERLRREISRDPSVWEAEYKRGE